MGVVRDFRVYKLLISRRKMATVFENTVKDGTAGIHITVCFVKLISCCCNVTLFVPSIKCF